MICDLDQIRATRCDSRDVMPYIIRHHYLHRKVGAQFAFALVLSGRIYGAVTFGCPPSRHLQKSACPTDPDAVVELNRLWLDDLMPKCSASRFVADALRKIPPRIVVSYADTAAGHLGTVYRALNFNYSGWTDEDRKTPRYDYVVVGKHSRDAFRSGGKYRRVRRLPKIRFWIATGTRAQRRALASRCGWTARKWDGGPPSCERPMQGHAQEICREIAAKRLQQEAFDFSGAPHAS